MFSRVCDMSIRSYRTLTGRQGRPGRLEAALVRLYQSGLTMYTHIFDGTGQHDWPPEHVFLVGQNIGSTDDIISHNACKLYAVSGTLPVERSNSMNSVECLVC